MKAGKQRLRKEVGKMDVGAIASASVDMHINQTMNQVSISMLKKTMDMAELENEALIESLNQANPASFGQLLDTYA
ncbi:MAG: YjfB family protein [Oscillospiraceae bacterium]|nr:YjfB family protein [Oscillospiraceae bacterium]